MPWRMRLPWRPSSSRHEPGLSYQVTCTCGTKLTGKRQASHLILSCPKCESPVFVFPRSPWGQPSSGALAAQPTNATPGSFHARDWLMMVAAALVALGVLVLAYRWFVSPSSLLERKADRSAKELSPREALLARHARAEKLLADGSFRLAIEELSAGGEKVDLTPLSGSERPQWDQTQRQAALLADLIAEPLEDVLIHAAGTRELEWLVEFDKRYKDKSVIFDAEIQRGPKGGWQIRYPLMAGRDRARLAMDNLAVLKLVPGLGPERLLIGARLASIQLEPPGPTWVVRFQGESGVLLTNPGAARLFSPADDKELVKTLQRMASWLD
ncbi:MAG: hypothetical protein HY040_15000 [Planctomycetes bacterium]|nr:hypothetical protein [Planctomycetota bacterium]